MHVRRLLAILAILLCALAGARGVAHAAIGACGSDPIVYFYNGQTVSFQSYADTSELSHVTGISYTVYGNPANRPTAHSMLVPGERIIFSQDGTLTTGQYRVELTVTTNDGSTAQEEVDATSTGDPYADGQLNHAVSLTASF